MAQPSQSSSLSLQPSQSEEVRSLSNIRTNLAENRPSWVPQTTVSRKGVLSAQNLCIFLKTV